LLLRSEPLSLSTATPGGLTGGVELISLPSTTATFRDGSTNKWLIVKGVVRKGTVKFVVGD
jgi:hypothetical protein